MGYNAGKHIFGEPKMYGEKDSARFFVRGGVLMNNEAFRCQCQPGCEVPKYAPIMAEVRAYLNSAQANAQAEQKSTADLLGKLPPAA